MRPIITLLTDFGTADGYVAEMKGVLLSMTPEAMLVDLSHEIPPQDIESARLAVARYWRRFPPESVHIVVIDPGVGSARAALAVESDARLLVGPDNGVLSPALLLAGARAVSIPVSPTASATFHGRDVFAPAAAQLAAGFRIDALGEPYPEPIIRRTPETHRLEDGGIGGEIVTVDRFGNAVTNLLAPRGGVVEVAGRSLVVRRTYGEVAEGELTAVIGSTGLVEIAQRDGNAARSLGIARGTPVVLRR
jgi:S-adenosyl-L-methionine hydrolase (adenosine-forming)